LPPLVLLATSCGQHTPTPEECKALAAPKAVLTRCAGGDLQNGKYVGDLKCWPFSQPHRLHGIWVVGLEASAFYPSDRAFHDAKRPDTWLQSDLLERPGEVRDATGGAGTRVYAVDLDGREALCDGFFGHFGMYPRQIIAGRFYSMRLIPTPK